jgi:dihydroorotase-like cyclic amidohydrolase
MVEETLDCHFMTRNRVHLGNGRYHSIFILNNALPYKREDRDSMKMVREITTRKWNMYRHAAASNLFDAKFGAQHIGDNWYLTVKFSLTQDIASDQDLHELKKLLSFFFLFERDENDEDQYRNIQEVLTYLEELNLTINMHIRIDEEGNLFLEDRQDENDEDKLEQELEELDLSPNF